ncbi:MAG: hypothetical protein MZV63_31655 [Marinilabiliales bacterium]|nr:hypothetical protein [Marinilabiliales bacterium]
MISQIIGPVVDVTFDKQGTEMPDIYDALEIKRNDGSILVVECQQHIGENTVRAIAMDSTDGLQQGNGGSCHRAADYNAYRRTDQGTADECYR